MPIQLMPETYQKLLTSERMLTDVVAELDKAEKCGIDCQNYRETLRQQLATMAQLKANYAPKMG